MKLELTAYLAGLIAARDSDALHHLRVALVEAESAVVTLRRADALNTGGHEATRREFQRLADAFRCQMQRNLALAFRVAPSGAGATALAEGPASAGAGAPSVVDPNPAPRPISGGGNSFATRVRLSTPPLLGWWWPSPYSAHRRWYSKAARHLAWRQLERSGEIPF